MERRRAIALLLALLLALSSGLALAEAGEGIQDSAQFIGKKIGVLTGSVQDQMLQGVLPGAIAEYFNSEVDMMTALKAGRIDGYLSDEPVLRYCLREVSGIKQYPGYVKKQVYALAMANENQELCDAFSGIIREMKEDGTLQALEQKWFDGSAADQVLPNIALTPTNGTLRVGVNTNLPPFCFVKDGQIVGYDVEIIIRICEKLGYDVQVTDVDFAGLIPGLVSGRFDMAASCITVTEERMQSVLFTEPDYEGGVVMAVRDDPMPAQAYDGEYSRAEEMTGKKIGSLTGTVFDMIVDRNIANVEHVYLNDIAGEIEALRSGKIDAIALDEPVARLMVSQNTDLTIMKEVLEGDQYGLAMAKGSPLVTKVSGIIERFAADGTLDALAAKWFGADESLKTLPELDYKADFDGSAGTMRFGHDTTTVPMSYVGDGGKSLGYDVELGMRIAYELNMKIELVPMEFSALITALVSGKVDMVSGCMSITEERRKSVDFPTSYYKGGVVLVVRRVGAAALEEQKDFWAGLSDSFNRTFIVEERYKLILRGLWVTLQISILATLLGTFLGFLICMMRRSGNPLLSFPAKVYIRVLQGTPIVVVLMILYYLVFRDPASSAILVAVIGFAVNFAAYVSEMMRTGIDAVDKGQIEAASAMGFNKVQVFMKVTLPQAARHFLPVFKGEFISTVKMTSVVGYITIQDLTKMSDIIRSRTYDAFFPLIATALIYFLIANLLAGLLTLVEVRIDPKHRRRAVKGVSVK